MAPSAAVVDLSQDAREGGGGAAAAFDGGLVGQSVTKANANAKQKAPGDDASERGTAGSD